MQTPHRFETTCIRLCVFFPLPLSSALWHGQKEWNRVERAFSGTPPVAAGPHLAVRCQVREAFSFHLARTKTRLMCLSERVLQCCDLSFFSCFSTILRSSTWDNCSLIGWQEMKNCVHIMWDYLLSAWACHSERAVYQCRRVCRPVSAENSLTTGQLNDTRRTAEHALFARNVHTPLSGRCWINTFMICIPELFWNARNMTNSNGVGQRIMRWINSIGWHGICISLCVFVY